MALLKLKLHWQILIALALAIVVGLLVGDDGLLFGINFVAAFDFIGQLFLNALKMLIVPLIVSSIIIGIAGIGIRTTSGGSAARPSATTPSPAPSRSWSACWW
jgi:proton glutamate symport protein